MPAALSPTMQAALQRYRETGSLEGVRPNTLAALTRRALIPETQRLGTNAIKPAGETIDVQRTQYYTTWYDAAFRLTPTRDVGQANYGYWDRARRGQVRGLEIAGLLIKPLGSKKAAWVMGSVPKFKFKRPKTQTLFAAWYEKHHPDIIRAYNESVDLADCYLVINPPTPDGDLPVTVVPPHVVTPLVDEQDFSQRIGYRITEVHPHPQRSGDSMTIVDDYTASQRVRKIYRAGVLIETQTYPNLIGRVPVIKISNNRGSDEEFGHPEAESMVGMFQAYGEVIMAAIQGNIKQGRPTPVIDKMGDFNSIMKWWNEFGRKEQRRLPDGSIQELWVLDLSSDSTITLGGTAEFKYVIPGSFSTDTLNILGLLYWLYIEHTEFPEFIMGTAIASSHASADAQMPPFIKFIEKNQGEALHWVVEMANVVVAYLSLFEAGVAAHDEPNVQFQPLAGKDGQLTLDAITLALKYRLIDDETALTLMPLDIEDPKAVLEKVKAQLEGERQEALRANGDIEISDVDDAQTGQEAVNRYRQSLSEARHTGAMVAFLLDSTAAQTLAKATADAGVEDGVDPDDLHLTLAYLGQTGEMDASEEAVMQALGEFALGEFDIRGSISGIGLFTNQDEGDVHVLYASFDSPDLPAFRQALVEALRGAGVEIDTEHGFTPHITLAYLSADDPIPDIKPPPLEMVFSKLTLAWGDTLSHFDLKGEPVTV